MDAAQYPFGKLHYFFRKADYARWHRQESKRHILRSQLGFGETTPSAPSPVLVVPITTEWHTATPEKPEQCSFVDFTPTVGKARALVLIGAAQKDRCRFSQVAVAFNQVLCKSR